MRHRIKGNRLGRKADHRKALLRNLATSLALHGHLTTTTAKAKALKGYVEPLLHRVRQSNDVNALRFLHGELFNPDAVKNLFTLSKELKRTSGWLRLIKVGVRMGDSAEVTSVEFVR